jgi:hypothetical protein
MKRRERSARDPFEVTDGLDSKSLAFLTKLLEVTHCR